MALTPSSMSSFGTVAPNTAGLLLGIEIGGTKLQIFSARDGAVLDRQRRRIDPALGAPGILREIESILATVEKPISGCAVGFGGPVDWRTGRIARSHQISGWSDFDLAAWISGRIAAPCQVENDANTAALGETVAGAGQGFDPIFYMTLGSGVGGGLTVGGRIYHGASPGEAEVGHVRLDKRGATVEDRCSGWAVDAQIRALIASGRAGLLKKLVGSETSGEAKHLGTACDQGDPDARALLDSVTEDLAFALSHAVHLFHPARIIIGGGLSLLGEPLRAGVAAKLPRWTMEVFHPGPSVALAGLGEAAVPIGALELARQAFLG